MIIVTGGAGFIGSHLVKALEARGARDIVVVDRLGQGEKWRNLAKREIAGLVAPEDMFGFLDAHAPEIEAVLHMGAISATTETDGDLVARTNLALSLRLWEWCSWRGARLIYASSAATYGDGSGGFEDDQSPDALARFRPLNLYGWSKHAFDRRVARLVERGAPAPPQWAGLKFFNVYGPNERHKGAQASLIEPLYRRAIAGEPARLFKSYRDDVAHGEQKRDFVWIGDCVAAVLFLLDRPEVNGMFNIGTGMARSFLDLAQSVYRAAGVQPRIEFIDMPAALIDQYQYFTQAPMDRLRRAGFDVAATPIEDGVRRYVEDYLATADPYA